MTGAIIGSALIGGVVASKGAKTQASAATSAAQTQATAATTAAEIQAKSQTENIAFQKWLFAEQKALQAPWQERGLQAMQQYADAPEFSFTAADMTADPSYQFRQQEAINALDKSAASRGRLLSGGQDRAVTRYASDLASQEYQNAYGRSFAEYQTGQNELLNLANIGRGAAGQIQSAGAQLGTSVGNAYTQGGIAQAGMVQNAGNAIAQGQLGAGQATASAYQGIGQSVNQGIGNYMLYNSLQQQPIRT